MRYRYVVRLGPDDVGSRVVIRWQRADTEVADVLGILESADPDAFVVRKSSGEMVTVPRERALAGKPVPAAPSR